MSIVDQFISGVGQIIVVLTLALLFFLPSKLVFKNPKSFRHFLGLQFSPAQFDRTFVFILLFTLLFGVVNTSLQFIYSEEMKALLTSDTSPFYKILKGGLTWSALLAGVIYCFIQSGGAEEILFRGLIGVNLIEKLGFQIGNLIQALLFWLMHLLIFKLATGLWFSKLQVMAFFISFFLGLILGYVNYRKNASSIVPSWILHSSANFSTLITLSFLLKN